MIVHDPNEYIDDNGTRFVLPFGGLEKDDGLDQIIEFQTKVVILFFVSTGHEADHRNIICFDRATGEVLWLIEPYAGKGWIPEDNRNLYLEQVIDGAHYGAMSAFHRTEEGHLWIEEEENKERQGRSWRSYSELERRGLIARHPEYRNEGRYRYVEMQDYWIRSDTHELEVRDMEVESSMPQPGERGYRSMEERGYCGVVYHTDMTAFEEKDCLLVVESALYVFSFEVDLDTGRVTPAYAMTGETK